jgi:hypothetical protein
MKRTFDDWMSAVNAAVERLAGLSADDLPDVCYRDWYDDDVSPVSAARRAIRSALDE